jgi:hypothetical protein
MGSKLQEYKEIIERNLVDKSKPWTKYFDRAEQKTGVNRVYLFVGESLTFSTFIYIHSSRFDVGSFVQVWSRSPVYI